MGIGSISNRLTDREIEVANEYFKWLYSLVDPDKVKDNYWHLLNRLHRKDFYWTVANDDNRAEDGKALRTRFSAETGYTDIDLLFGPCTVLEMMIGLSIRIENDIMWDYSLPDRTATWFWMMINNLGFSNFTDDIYDLETDEYVDYRLDVLVERRYESNGDGGLFPLKRPYHDQKNIEIWDQMSQFLGENRLV